MQFRDMKKSRLYFSISLVIWIAAIMSSSLVFKTMYALLLTALLAIVAGFIMRKSDINYKIEQNLPPDYIFEQTKGQKIARYGAIVLFTVILLLSLVFQR